MIARAATVVILLALVAATSAADPPSVSVLEREVREHPDDVDLRLRLAIALSWTARSDDARREALEVLARSPDYHDAALVLARIDAWERRWMEARARVDRVLAAQPAHVDARLLAFDIALWSGDLAAARRALAALPVAQVPEIDLRYRQAQVAYAEGRNREALALARRVTELDSAHAGARSLRASISLFSMESATDAELFPSTQRDRFAVGETLTATIFPRARWSATAVYEYRRRFATDNHRVALRGDWRPHDRWTVLAFLRAGVVEVVPRVTALGEARWNRGAWMAAGRYTYDRMPWSGDLHRLQISAGVPLSRALRAEADFALGTLRGCETSARVWNARARVAWTRGRWDLAGAYGYGLEAERAIVGPDPCANPMRILVDHDVHAGGIDVTRTLRRGLALRVGYGLELRGSETLVHLGTLAIRTWL